MPLKHVFTLLQSKSRLVQPMRTLHQAYRRQSNRCEILFILLAINKDIGSASKQPPKDRNFFSGENKAESDEFGAWC